MGFNSRRMLAIGTGIAQGLDKAMDNIADISTAKDKLKKDNETFKMDMKIKKLQIQKAEDFSSPEQTRLRNEKLKTENKIQNAALEKATAANDAARTKALQDKKSYEQGFKFLEHLMSGEDADLSEDTEWEYGKDGMTFSGGGKRKISKPTQDALKALGDYETKEQALQSIEKNRRNLELSGADIDYLITQAQEKFPETFDRATKREKLFGAQKFDKRIKDGELQERQEDQKWHKVDVKLPETITKMSEAIPYLRDTYRLSDEAAREWLKSANKER